MKLRAIPLTDDKFSNGQDTSFPMYIETKNKIYLPKMFGINEFGAPDKILSNYEGAQWDNNIEFKGKLFDFRGYRTRMTEKKIMDTVKWGKPLLGILK